MKSRKFRVFVVLLSSGESVIIKHHTSLTEEYFKVNAYHYVNKKLSLNISQSDVISVTGMD